MRFYLVACEVGLAVVLFAVLALPLAFMVAIAAVLALGYAIYYFGGKAISQLVHSFRQRFRISQASRVLLTMQARISSKGF